MTRELFGEEATREPEKKKEEVKKKGLLGRLFGR